MGKPEIFVDNVLHCFYFMDPSERAVLYPYTESLLDLCLKLEAMLQISVVTKLISSGELVKWPDFQKEKSLEAGETNTVVLGSMINPQYELLKVTEYKKYFAPFLDDLNIPKKTLIEYLVDFWAVPLSGPKFAKLQTDVSTALTYKCDVILKLKDPFKKLESDKKTMIDDLISVCNKKHNLYISFSPGELLADIYLNIQTIDVQLIVLIIIAASEKKYDAKIMKQFATWYNIIDYFWGNLAKYGVSITSSNLGYTINYNQSPMLPILFSSGIKFIS